MFYLKYSQENKSLQCEHGLKWNNIELAHAENM